MEKKYINICIFFVLSSLLWPVKSYGKILDLPRGPEYYQMTVSTIATSRNLPPINDNCIVQDNKGFIWYGSDNGVYRDDGYQVRLFPFDSKRKIKDMVVDGDGNLLLGTDSGPYIFEVSDYTYKRIDDQHVANLDTRKVFVDRDGYVWIGVYGYIHKFDKNYEWICSYATFDRRQKPTFVAGMTQSRDGTIYMTSFSRGVYHYVKASDKFVMDKELEDDLSLTDLFQDKDGDYFWVISMQSYVVRFNPNGDETYVCTNVRNYSRDHPVAIHFMAQDTEMGLIWITSMNQTLALKPLEDGTVRLVDNSLSRQLRYRMMSRILPIKGGVIVTGMDHASVKGIYDSNMGNEIDLDGMTDVTNSVPQIQRCEFNYGDYEHLWVVQPRLGLMVMNMTNAESVIATSQDDMRELRMHKAVMLSPAKFYKGMWIGCEGSTLVQAIGYNPNARLGERFYKIATVEIHAYMGATDYVTAIYEDGDMLWVGTNVGLFKRNLKKEKLEEHFHDIGSVTGIARDLKGRIYAATSEEGVYRFSDDEAPEHLITEKDCAGIKAAADGSLWVLTVGSEVYRYDPEADQLEDFTFCCHAEGGKVNHILMGPYGIPWVVTDRALIEINPKDHSTRWHHLDGDYLLKHYQWGCLRVNPQGKSEANDTTLLFAGLNCMTEYNALPISSSTPSRVNTYICDVEYGNRSAIFDDRAFKRGDNPTIYLPTEASAIAISFSSLSQGMEPPVRYTYYMEGVDEEWQFTKPGSNQAVYHHMPPGNHRFKVRCTDEHGLWSAATTEIVLYRKPYWYATWWAYLLYVLLGGCIAYLLIRKYTGKVKADTEQRWAESEAVVVEMYDYLNNREPLPDEKALELDTMILDKITKTIEENIANPDFDVNSLAREVGMSRSTLFRKIKTITGQSPADMMKTMKMQRAQRLLRDKDRTISEVSELVGFVDRRQFTSVFKREVGVTPTVFRKQALGDAVGEEVEDAIEENVDKG